MYLFLSFADRRYLNDLVEGARPKEACSFLLGKFQDEAAVVMKIIPADNTLDSPLAFEISPSEVFNVFDVADRLHLEVIGVYHSHLAPPKPSEIDLHYMKVNPMVWLIVSMLDYSIEAYYPRGEDVKRLEILP
jgi:proteasome lid subunit RPN8/RPN11